jgi:thiamine-phosphate pyrophosphorylase
MIRARAIEADVGRSIQADREYKRDDVASVATAAGKRATEALRALEENAKVVDANCALGFERMRYDVYAVERALAIRIDARRRFDDVGLYVLITESLCTHEWLTTARRAMEGGADCIQLREKSLADAELLDRARPLAAICRDAGAMFIVNDRPDIARLAGADGVHLGQDDMSVADARRVLLPSMIVGRSTHDIEQVRLAADESPDYIAVGPMFDTPTKPQSHIPGPKLVRDARAETSIPIVAIGGIDEQNVGAVVDAGANAVCVCSAVIARDNVASAAEALKRRIESRHPADSPAAADRPT